jgi:FtsH-binding integral membrane protein
MTAIFLFVGSFSLLSFGCVLYLKSRLKCLILLIPVWFRVHFVSLGKMLYLRQEISARKSDPTLLLCVLYVCVIVRYILAPMKASVVTL